MGRIGRSHVLILIGILGIALLEVETFYQSKGIPILNKDGANKEEKLNVVQKQEQKNDFVQKLLKYSVNRTLIVTVCNHGMTQEWLQQWYVSACRVGITNMIVVVTDESAYRDVASMIGDRAILFSTIAPLLDSARWSRLGLNGEVSNKAFNWRSIGYERVVTQRATILKALVSKTRLNILYADTDIHWLQNPLLSLTENYAKYHVCVQRERGDELGDYNCSGFMFLRYSELTELFLSTWEQYIKRRLKRKGFFTDQEELNILLRDMQSKHRGTELPSELQNFSVTTLDWDMYPSGINYFSNRIKGKGKKSSTCQSKICEKLIWVPIHKPSKRRNDHKNFIVHHNFAKSNHMKIQRAKDFGLWLNLKPDDWCQASQKESEPATT